MGELTIGGYFVELIKKVEEITGLKLRPYHYSDTVVHYAAELNQGDGSVIRAQVSLRYGVGIKVYLDLNQGSLGDVMTFTKYYPIKDVNTDGGYEKFVETVMNSFLAIGQDDLLAKFERFNDTVAIALKLFSKLLLSIDLSQFTQFKTQSIVSKARKNMVDEILAQHGLKINVR